MDSYEENEIFILVKEGLNEVPPIPKETKYLDVRRNKLQKLCLDNSILVEYLDASDNLIKTFHETSGIETLKILDLGYNLISKIPKVVFPDLRELYLMSNDIYKIENIGFEKLEKLDLANNDISVLENIDCPNLREGYFGANMIGTIKDLTSLSYLNTLDLQFNKLKEIDCAFLPKNLEVLLLQGNKDLKIIKNLDKLSKLHILGIKGTKVNLTKKREGLEIW